MNITEDKASTLNSSQADLHVFLAQMEKKLEKIFHKLRLHLKCGSLLHFWAVSMA